MGRRKPAHRLVHPPARQPYAMPNTSTPANVYDSTPQRTKTATEVRRSVVEAMIHGLTMSESMPRPRRPTNEAALSSARESDASFALSRMDETYAANVNMSRSARSQTARDSLGSQRRGTKYASPCSVFAMLMTQNVLSFSQNSRLWCAAKDRGWTGPWVRRDSGRRPRTKGSIAASTHMLMME